MNYDIQEALNVTLNLADPDSTCSRAVPPRVSILATVAPTTLTCSGTGTERVAAGRTYTETKYLPVFVLGRGPGFGAIATHPELPPLVGVMENDTCPCRVGAFVIPNGVAVTDKWLPETWG